MGADVLIGVVGGQVAEQDIASMAPGAVVSTLANPDPEVGAVVAGRQLTRR